MWPEMRSASRDAAIVGASGFASSRELWMIRVDCNRSSVIHFRCKICGCFG